MSNNFLSYNVASSTSLSGVSQLIDQLNPIFVFLQEVTISTEQLSTQFGNNYSGICNIDPNYERKPGTAILWKKEVEVEITNVTPGRLQVLRSKVYGDFVNVYAPTGCQGERMRRILFTQDLFDLIQSSNTPPII